jgi:hypothetical protein
MTQNEVNFVIYFLSSGKNYRLSPFSNIVFFLRNLSLECFSSATNYHVNFFQTFVLIKLNGRDYGCLKIRHYSPEPQILETEMSQITRFHGTSL